MVGFVSGDPNQGSKLSISTDPLDPVDKIGDCGLSFPDSFLDFENIEKWIEEMSESGGIASEKVQLPGAETCTEMVEEGSCKETVLGDPDADGSESIVDSSEQIIDGSDCCVKELGGDSTKVPTLGSLIEEEMGKVSLAGLENDSAHVGGNNTDMGHIVENMDTLQTNDLVSSGSESESTSESESSTASCPSTSSGIGDDDSDVVEEEGSEEEKEVVREEQKEVMGGEVEEDIEEGEIRDEFGRDDDDDEEEEEDGEMEEEMIGGSDYEGEDDGADDGKGRPIKSKNEVEVLPPVPQLDVTLQPHHQTLPVGVVLSIIGTKVIVEGAEKHNPLTEGSILWITESRSSLGLVDEIFGPVRNPYYVVRYNTNNEIPVGIREGTSISFVTEFANHILNDNNLYKKGYDASGENDEEVSDVEFSDDEKEAEYKKMLKMTKRGTNCQKPGNKKNNRKKGKVRDGPWRNGCHEVGTDQLAPDQGQHHAPQVTASSPFGTENFFAGGGLVPPYPQMTQVAGFIPPSSGIWGNGVMHCQQQQGSVFPNGYPTDAMRCPPQNGQPHPFQMPNNHQLHPFQMPNGMSNGMLFQQPFDPGHTAFPNAVLSPGQPNFFMRPMYLPFPGLGMQIDHLNQATFATGLQSQLMRPILGAGEQGVASTGLPVGQSCDVQPPTVSEGTVQAHQQFNHRSFSGRGKKPFHRGDGRFAGGRGGGGRGRGRGRGKRHYDVS